MGLLPLLILCSTLCIQQIYAPNNSGLIYSKDSKPFGKLYADWMSEAWVQHQTLPSDTRVDYSPEKCTWNQNNEYVHFLPGGDSVSEKEAENAEERYCEVPYGKAIAVIIYGGTCNETEEATYEGRKDCAELGLGIDKNPLRRSVEFNVTVDGVLVMDAMNQSKQKVEKYLPNCKEFNLTINSTQNAYGYPPGPHITHTCGYIALLTPPSVGNHNLTVYANYRDAGLPEGEGKRITHFTYLIHVK